MNLREAFPDVRVQPEVHSPDQREGDVASIGLFPNAAYVVLGAEDVRGKTEAERARKEAQARERAQWERAFKAETERANKQHMVQEVEQQHRVERHGNTINYSNLLRYLLIVGLAVAVLWTASFFWPLIIKSGEGRLKAQQATWTVEINDAFCRNASKFGGFRARLHAPRELPDVLTTAQALTALLSQPSVERHQANIDEAFAFLESRRRTVPFPGWTYSAKEGETATTQITEATAPITEISAWVAVAKAYAIKSTLQRSDQAVDIARSTIYRDLDLLAMEQNTDGSWSPLAAIEQAKGTSRTYTVAIALWAFLETKQTGDKQFKSAVYDRVIENGVRWLLKNQGSGGWVPNPSRNPQHLESYLGLTAQVLYILSIAEKDFPWIGNEPAYRNAERGFVNRLEFPDVNDHTTTTNDDGDVQWTDGSQEKVFPISTWTFCSYPWTIAELRVLTGAANLDASTRFRAKMKLYRLLARFPQAVALSSTYEVAENLYCARFVVGPPEPSN